MVKDARFRDRASTLATVEYTWDLGNYLAGYGFVDFGRVWPSLADFEFESFRVGFGGGIHAYATNDPAGQPQAFGGYGKQLKNDYRRLYGATVNFAGRGEMVDRFVEPGQRSRIVRHDDKRSTIRRPARLDHGKRCAGFQRVCDEGVAVAVGSLDGDERLTDADCAAVNGDSGDPARGAARRRA